jgi:DNA-binding FadR family transcriptional regulator
MMGARANGLPAKQTNTAVIDRSATIRAPKVPELMASDVRRRIMRGDLRDGDSLPPEAELMAQYNVSRPSLREALRILESDALIVVRRGGHGGAVVRRPTMEVTARHFGLSLQERGAHVEDVYHARTVLEPPAIAELARNATSAQITLLTQKLAEVDAFIGSPARYAHAISEFREFMIGLTGNITLSLLVRLIDEVLERHQAQTGDARGEAWVAQQRKSQRSLRKLLALIEARDAEGAEEFWRKHLREAARHLFVDGKGASVIDLLG